MLTALLAAGVATLAVAQQVEPTAQGSAIERAEKHLRQGQHDEAIEALRGAIAPDRAAAAERTRLADILAWLGRSDEALDVLQKGIGLGSKDDDTRLQWQIGSQLRQLGHDGPFFRHEGGHVVYLPKDDKVDEGAWRNERYRKALAAFQAVLAHRPDWDRAHERVGEMQERLEQHEAALATWTAAELRFPKSSAVPLGRARALTALGRADEAAAACTQALQNAPQLAEAHAMLAEHFEKAGKTEDAQREREQARFCEWVPDFLELDFGSAGESFRRLAPRFEEKPSDEVLERARKDRAAEIERLLQTPGTLSSRLLAVLCYQHGDHGAAEDRMFAALQARGAESIGVLRGLLENAQSTCTQKSAARALASLRAPGILATLLEMLPGDVRALYHADIAGALAELGDRAAVPPLLEFANLGGRETEGEAGSEYMERQGREDARQRAVLALGVLGGDAARAALQGGVEHALLGPGCRVALYRLTRDESMVDAVRAAVLAADSLQQLYLIDHLESFAPALAKELRAKKG